MVLALLRSGGVISASSIQSSATTVTAASNNSFVKMDPDPGRSALSIPGDPCGHKRSLDAGSSENHLAGTFALNQTQLSSEANQQLLKARKLWLYTAVEPAPGGSGSQICRYCGTILSSSNITVRKKVCLLVIIKY